MDDRIYSEWSSAARQLGLKAVLKRNVFRGSVADLLVELTREGGVHRVVVHARLPAGFSLSRETMRSRVGGLLGAGDLVTGDPDFDFQFRVTAGADDVRIRAALSSVTRAEIRRLLQVGVRVGADTLEYATAEVVIDPDAVVAMTRDLAQLAKWLSVAPPEVPERLFDNTFDPQPEVRLRCLQALLDSFPDSGDCERGATTALSDSDVRVRLLGALATQSGARGVEALRKMAADGSLALEDRESALEGFLVRAAPERALEGLVGLQSDASLPARLRRAAARALARLHGKSVAGRVSLAGSTRAGALSEPAEAGAVSVVREPKPRRRR